MTAPYNDTYWSDPALSNPTLAALRGSDIQEVSITDLISEGPIEGLVKGEASVYIAGDQLSNMERTLVESGKAELTGEPYSITFAAASSDNQPVTATMLDRQGSTAYYNGVAETFTDEYTYRWLTVHEEFKAKVKIEGMQSHAYTQYTTKLGNVELCAVLANNTETDFFPQNIKPADGAHNPTLHNLKAICRLTLPSGQTVKGSIISTHGANFNSESNSGSTKRAVLQPWGTAINSYGTKDIFDSSTNAVYGEIIIDRVFEVEIKTESFNNVIYIPKNSASISVSNKTFSLTGEVQVKGATNTGGTPEGSKKYPGSSVEFRVGSRSQEPFYQLAGRGVASFPVTLSSSQSETFDNTNQYPSTIPTGYPTISPLPTGMVQKNIVFSNSFSSAQINEIDRVKIQFEFPQGHYAMTDGGDDISSGAAFSIRLEGSESGGSNPTDWSDIAGGAYNYQKWFGVQKTAIAYAVEIPINTHLNFTDMRLSVTRLTPDGNSNSNKMTGKLTPEGYIVRNTSAEISAVVDSVRIAQVIATIDEKLEHPYSAMAAIRFSSKSFPAPPKRAYHARGMKVKIPSNYTPRHLSSSGVASYSGIWNGEFSDEGVSNSSGLGISVHYTDNPAWVFYDMLVNNRYGLGAFLDSSDINAFQLYKIAKYCDELVPASDGTTEPRFTANLYLTKATQAYKVLKDMATIFRGILYWLDGEMLAVHDAPGTPIYNFSQSNMLEGSLSTQTSSSKSRINQWVVTWNNPLAGYAKEPIIVEDKQNIIDTGRILRKQAVAFGCTSEGQAIRYGRWKAWTSVNQTEVINFKTSVNALFLNPGDIVNVHDQANSGIAFSGRITDSSSSTITLDRNVTTSSQVAQIDGGATQSFSFQPGNDYEYYLSLLVTRRAVVLSQEKAIVTHGGTAYTYYRGDEVVYGKIGGTSTVLIGTNDSDLQVEKNISNIQDDDGKDIIVDFRNSTDVQKKKFEASNVSIVNGATRVAIPSAFSGTIPTNTVWSIKEVYKGVNTKPSYKEYKILGIKEDKDSNFEISCVEFYNSKFDSVDNDFNLFIVDPIDPPEPSYVPPPSSVYVMETPRHKTELQELQVMWETPLNSDGTDYRDLSSFILHIEPKLPDGTDTIPIPNSLARVQQFIEVPNGVRSFGVQTISKKGKRSEISWQVIEVRDIFAVGCDRTTEGVPLGVRTNSKMSESGATWSMQTIDWGIQSPGAPGTKVTNANQSNAGTYQQSITALSSLGRISIADSVLGGGGAAPVSFEATTVSSSGAVVNIGLITAVPTNRAPGIYTNVASTNGGGSTYNVTVQPAAGHKTVSNIGAASSSRAEGTYLVSGTSNRAAATVGGFRVIVNNLGACTVTVYAYGAGNVVGDTITIPDSSLGSGGAAALTMTVASLTTTGTIDAQDVQVSNGGTGVKIGVTGFIYFDADATSDYFKLASTASAIFENTTQPYWRDLTQYEAAPENDWTDCTNSANARVTILPRSNKIVKSAGTTSFATRFKLGDIVRIKYATGKYVGGKVTFIQSNDIMYVDRRLSQNTTLVSMDENKAIARNTLRVDTANDAIIAQVSRSGNTFTHIPLKWVEDLSITGSRALIVDATEVILRYNTSDVLQGEGPIALTAQALGYTSPEFTVTGAGFSGVSSSAQSSFIGGSNSAVTGQILTLALHNGSSGIAYNSGTALVFTISVREQADQSNAKSKTFSIIKVKDGLIGEDGTTVFLTADDYSIIYDEEGINPLYTSSGSSNIVLTAQANNFTDPLYRFTFASETPGPWQDTAGASNATYTFTAAAIPDTYDKSNWPKVVKVQVGEKPTSYSAGQAPDSITATDSVSIIGVKTGAGGIAISNSNSAHTYTVGADGNIIGHSNGVATIPNSSTTIEVIVGGVVYTYIGGTGGYNNPTYTSGGAIQNKQWYMQTPTNTGSDLTIGTPSSVSNNVVTIGNHSTQAGTNKDEIITYVIAYKQANESMATIKTTQTLTKSFTGDEGQAGLNNATAEIYKLSASSGGASTKPIGNTTYTFGATGAKMSFSDANGWAEAPPSPTTSVPYLYRKTAVASSNTSTDIIADSEWSSGNLVTQPGEAARATKLTASRYVVVYSEAGVAQGNDIVLSWGSQNVGSNAQYKVTVTKAGTTTQIYPSSGVSGTATTVNLPSANPDLEPALGTEILVTITVYAGTNNAPLGTDSISIHAVQDGKDALTLIVPNSSHTLNAAANGAVSTSNPDSYVGSGTDIRVFKGSTPVLYAGPGLNTWGKFSVTTSGSGITVGAVTKVQVNISDDTARVAKHSGVANSTDIATITYTVIVRDVAGNATILTAIQSITKAKVGPTGNDSPIKVTGYVYWQGAVATTSISTLQNFLSAVKLQLDAASGDNYTIGTQNQNSSFNPNIGGGTPGTTATGSTSAVDNWSTSPPVTDATRSIVFYAPFTVTETVTNGNGTNTGTVVFGTVAQGTSFNGLVTFSSLSSTGTTQIDGDRITTGTMNANRLQLGETGRTVSRVLITDDVVKIFEGTNVRVILGNLSSDAT
jgi:hypothetical protein